MRRSAILTFCLRHRSDNIWYTLTSGILWQVWHGHLLQSMQIDLRQAKSRRRSQSLPPNKVWKKGQMLKHHNQPPKNQCLIQLANSTDVSRPEESQGLSYSVSARLPDSPCLRSHHGPTALGHYWDDLPPRGQPRQDFQPIYSPYIGCSKVCI